MYLEVFMVSGIFCTSWHNGLLKTIVNLGAGLVVNCCTIRHLLLSSKKSLF